MVPLEDVFRTLRYDGDKGVIWRVSTGEPVYLEKTGAGPRLEVYCKYRGPRYVSARKVALAFILGRYPEKYEFRFVGDDPMDLRAACFAPRYKDGKKWCIKCEKFFPVEVFEGIANGKKKIFSYCPSCKKEHSREVNKVRRYEKYGLTEECYRKLLEKQNGACAICGDIEENQRHGTFSIDHCHDTGAVRGLLCQLCNTAIGQMKDDPKLLLRAAKYILANKAA